MAKKRSKHEIFKQREVIEIVYPQIKESKGSKAIRFCGELAVIILSIPLFLTLFIIAFKCLKIAIKIDIKP